ncbi:septal ring lytic transglycosylase RlpA family protein [Stappia sp. WLB 29]|uniref:septal ring lytic transglycosylase RlpA family protein n=1 Tax=Stappia sp. WLB 29 TaxID=2925220 RepID=UPI0020BE38E7|nr:septal ring lytic transglycosylase RlpA family protein [Stappia sp. WLB 29]
MIRKLRIHVLIALACAGLGALPALAECGRASWYELTGRTASGTRANPEALTAAHRKLPFGAKVQVENLSNGRKVTLTIVDRGPFVRGRVIDVSRRAARELKFINKGVTRVRVTVAGRAEASCD